MKRILITGAESYIGTNVEKWLSKFPDKYYVDTLDMRLPEWENISFSSYDTIFHVAGIAHADISKVSEETKDLYFAVNRDLAIKTCKKAKEEGVKQFIFMSSIIVYGISGSVYKRVVISKDTKPNPSNFYGESKYEAEVGIMSLGDEQFKTTILRPPMIYGKGSKGNYLNLSKIAKKVVVFPAFENERSMLHIDNLCEFIKLVIDNKVGGILFPQNSDYVKTSDMVRLIANANGKRLVVINGLQGVIFLLNWFPGRVGEMVKKAFGNLVYDKILSCNPGEICGYQIRNLEESIYLTERSEGLKETVHEK